MPDLTADRPVSGTPIATTWGDQVHDAIEGIQIGSVPIPGSASTGTVTVTFARPYVANPVIVATIQGSSTGVWIVAVGSTSPTSFTLISSKRDGSNVSNINAFWIAIGTLA